MKRHKKAKFKGKYHQKYITRDPKTTFRLKSNVSPVKIYNKILDSWNGKMLEEEV